VDAVLAQAEAAVMLLHKAVATRAARGLIAR